MNNKHTKCEQIILLKEKGFELPIINYIVSGVEQHKIVDWLLEKHNIWITVTSISQESWQWHITKPGDSLGKLYEEDFYNPQEAYIAAIDYVLNNLI